MAFQTTNTEHVIRSTLYTNQLKTRFEDKLTATPWVYMIPNFTDGDTINIPSMGQAEIYDYAEGNPVRFGAIDTGNFQFSINQYKQGGFYITNKMKQDSWMADQLTSQAGRELQLALDVNVERAILDVIPNGQTANNPNNINGIPHRWVTDGTNQVIELEDFAKARYALDEANIPAMGRIALVDPTVEFAISTLPVVIGQSGQNPAWNNFLETGAATDGTRFLRNIFGFDVYVSPHLKKGVNETINAGSGNKTSGAGVANLFFSAAGGDKNPIIGLVRQPPKVESWYDPLEQRENYILTMRYGFSLFRPENAVVVITDTDQVFV